MNNESFECIQKQCAIIAEEIIVKRALLEDLLLGYESYEVVEYEIRHTLDCLLNINKEKAYLGKKVQNISVFPPINLPFYSFFMFGVVPSFLCEKIYLRLPISCRRIMNKICEILEISKYFPNIQIRNSERNEFVDNYVVNSDVVIFTGAYKNAFNVAKNCKKESLFLFNGSGINPIVVSDLADIELAVKKTIDSKLFNSGQDCTSPDSILLSKNSAENFIEILIKELESIKVGNYRDRSIRVGKIIDPMHLQFVSKMFVKHKDNIIYGGKIDFANEIIYPTIIKTDCAQEKNYTEFFAPVFFLSVYENEDDLASYFLESSYMNNAMYVSIFGSCKIEDRIKKTIILKEKIALDMDCGNEEFGGYGNQSSFYSLNKSTTCCPILISREVKRYIDNLV